VCGSRPAGRARIPGRCCSSACASSTAPNAEQDEISSFLRVHLLPVRVDGEGGRPLPVLRLGDHVRQYQPYWISTTGAKLFCTESMSDDSMSGLFCYSYRIFYAIYRSIFLCWFIGNPHQRAVPRAEDRVPNKRESDH
jgi:hypothetical protein